eukprot:TRINITY_DN18166_c0_g1_i3.p2 TRINITY_DN18166_c0_g1~~TRINITY_DN18166_c0_g1_i3.p2  ORF type:complete len:189 (+),score=20.37 TRINITY_DN18166_c0_g1_i3:137-703(+)
MITNARPRPLDPYLVMARAALLSGLVGSLEADFVRNFHEGRREVFVQFLAVDVAVSGGGKLDGALHVLEVVARAALVALATSWARVRHAAQGALGLGACGWLAAAPGALGSRACGPAHGTRGSAESLALGWQANVLAQGAAARLAVLAGAPNFALGAFAADVALDLGELLTTELAVGLLALRLTHSRA